MSLRTERDGDVLVVTFDRPHRRNALTWAMYDGLSAALERAESEPGIRALVLRGAGGAFVAGTDIGQFTEIADGADGVRYEARITAVIDRLEGLRVPTVAVVEGACAGAGMLLATACDLRLAGPQARFGLPIARTLGNCLSVNSYSLLADRLGPARVLELTLRADLVGPDALAGSGFLTAVVEPDELEGTLAAVLDQLRAAAPLTIWATKQALLRRRRALLPDGDDLVAAVFGSEDFHHGVRAFLSKQRPEWTGH